jgi:riboflavin biosynthesis pyrimidine reductase
VVVNFISTIDGRTTFQGRSGQLGDEGDRAMFHGLRERADAVMAGVNTLRVERYGRMLSRPERRERRLQSGVSAEPLACIVTRSGQLPLDIPLFGEPEARVVVFAPADIELPPTAAAVELNRLSPDELTATTALRRLARDYEVRLLLCEGGPSLFASLLAEGLVDELFLTLAPNLAGGGPNLPLTHGPELPELVPLAPLWLLERARSLYLRYAVGPAVSHRS